MEPNHKISGKKRTFRNCKRCDRPFPADKTQCPSCGAWDAPLTTVDSADETILLSEVSRKPIKRITGIGPWDRIFSYDQETGECGLATVQTILVGGVPGAGKSTLAIQSADRICEITKDETFYIAAEEAAAQIKDRAERLQLANPHLIRVYPLGAGHDLGEIIQRRRPKAVVVDSLPALTNDLALAVHYCKLFKEYATILGCPFIIIDHANKGEELAGLMALQHEVDTTALFTVLDDNDDPNECTRRLETKKNRFGPLHVCYLKMVQKGLIAAENPYDDESDPEWNR